MPFQHVVSVQPAEEPHFPRHERVSEVRRALCPAAVEGAAFPRARAWDSLEGSGGARSPRGPWAAPQRALAAAQPRQGPTPGPGARGQEPGTAARPARAREIASPDFREGPGGGATRETRASQNATRGASEAQA